jgi:hypothetical protein
VALGIATFKATLVVLFFMHVKYSSRLTKLVVATSLFFLVILWSCPRCNSQDGVPAGPHPAGRRRPTPWRRR